MEAIVRSLSLLLLAMALMLPTVGQTSARPEAPIVTQATLVQSAIPRQASRMSMKCGRCFGKACDACAVACGTGCSTASALAPLVIVLALVSLPAATPSVFEAALDHGRAPDPPPPRLIVIS